MGLVLSNYRYVGSRHWRQVAKLLRQVPSPNEPSHQSPRILCSFHFIPFCLLLGTNIPQNSWLYAKHLAFLLSSETAYLLLSPSASRRGTKILLCTTIFSYSQFFFPTKKMVFLLFYCTKMKPKAPPPHSVGRGLAYACHGVELEVRRHYWPSVLTVHLAWDRISCSLLLAPG